MDATKTLFLRFTPDADGDLARGTSLDFLAVTRDEAGLTDTATHDAQGQLIVELEDGVWSIIPGLCGYELQAETVADALIEAAAMANSLPYGDFSRDAFAIYEGQNIKPLAFGDGIAFRPTAIVHRSA